MRARLAAYARSRVGCALGITGHALIAASDRLLGIPPGVLARHDIHRRTR